MDVDNCDEFRSESQSEGNESVILKNITHSCSCLSAAAADRRPLSISECQYTEKESWKKICLSNHIRSKSLSLGWKLEPEDVSWKNWIKGSLYSFWFVMLSTKWNKAQCIILCNNSVASFPRADFIWVLKYISVFLPVCTSLYWL